MLPIHAAPQADVNSPSIDATQLSGADACAKINAAWHRLPLSGGTVDARGFQGKQLCNWDPFAGVTTSGVLLLGGAAYQTSVPWLIPRNISVFGLGRGDARHGFNTSVQAQPGFPANSSVIQLGIASPSDGIHLESLAVDCNGQGGAIGVQNIHAEEQSGIEHVAIVNCPAIGLNIEGAGAQNTGPYEDIEVLNTTAGTQETLPVVVKSVAAFRGIHGLTINADGIPQPKVGMQIDSSGSFTDIHCEHISTCVVLGSQRATSGVVLSNLECGPDTATCAAISSLNSTQNILATALIATSGDILRDDNFDSLLQASSLAFYFVGNGAGRNKPRISSDVRIPIKTPGIVASLVTKSSDYQLTPADHWINVAAPASISVPQNIVGQVWVVFNSSPGQVVVRPVSGAINGGAYLLLPPNTGRELTCDGQSCFAH